MRTIIVLLVIISFMPVQAQTHFPLSSFNYINDSNHLAKNWSVSAYAGMAAGLGFFNGVNTAFSPMQGGLQLNRRLNNNLYAFAGVEVAPVFFNFNRPVTNGQLHKNYLATPGFNANGWGIYSGIQAGLMWVNDEKTFSISGSVGIGHSNYPFYPNSNANTQKKSPFTGARQ